MATKHVAWSHIKHHDGKKLVRIKPGTEVSAESLGMDEENFNSLVEAGAVRTTPWPEGLNPDNPSAPSPNTFRLQQLRKMREQLEEDAYGDGGAASEAEAEAEVNNDDEPPAGELKK